MNPRRSLSTLLPRLAVLILFLFLVGFAPAGRQFTARATAYVDPTLAEVGAVPVTTIVTGATSASAAQAVTAVGGTVTSDLGLIDAVGATVDAAQIAALARNPQILSIVNNHQLTAAAGPDCEDVVAEHGPCANRPGFVTDRQEKKRTTTLPGLSKIETQIVPLPDGRYVAVAEKTGLGFLLADGTLDFLVLDLDFDHMTTPPQVGTDGTVFFIGDLAGSDDKQIVYAIRPNGTVAWSYAQKKLNHGLALSADGAYVLVSSHEYKAKIYVLDAATGDLLVKAEPSTEKPGLFAAPPVVGADGTVYLWSTGKESGKDDRRPNILAVDPADFLIDNNDYLWRYQGSIGDEVSLAPVFTANGEIFLFDSHGKTVTVIGTANGAEITSFALDRGLTAQPLVAAGGTLLLPTDKHLYGYTGDGTLIFDRPVADGKFLQPLLSADGEIVFAVAGKTVYVLDAATGAVMNQVTLRGNVVVQPTLDADGNLIVGSDGKDLVIINPAGRVTSRLRLDDKFGQVVGASMTTDEILLLVGDKQMLTVGPLGSIYDPEQQDIQPTDIKDEWEIVNTLTIDIGADVVHATQRLLPDEDGDLEMTAITGAGVTVAVVDSGVYVDNHVKELLSSDLYATDVKQQFMGQYDFVGQQPGPDCDLHDYNAADGSCFFEWDKSRDPYGHGSHVAGIIWSQITDYSTSASMGVAPGANVVSVRVLGDDGTGTYEDVIQGIQWIVNNQDNPELEHPIRVMNLSLSAEASVPYFVDPINRAVEAAWSSGIVVLAAAGNEGPGAQTITVPGNDPYVITVGAVNSQRTPGYWADDELPSWSGSGPTLDGFVKPDIIAPGSQIVSFMHNDDGEVANLLHDHPDYAETMSLFRMNGTSMATAVSSGVVALVLQANPDLTPDQVKFRLMASAVPAVTAEGDLLYSPLRQGAGRLWAPEAVLGDFAPDHTANAGMDIAADLAHGWVLRDANGVPVTDADGQPLPDPEELAFHYQGPVRAVSSDSGEVVIFYFENPENGELVILGGAKAGDREWLDEAELADRQLTFEQALPDGTPWQHAGAWDSGLFTWGGGLFTWGGGLFTWGGGLFTWGGGLFTWGGGLFTWGGGLFTWGGGLFTWGGGLFTWGGGLFTWGGGLFTWGGGLFTWGGGLDPAAGSIGANKWVDDDFPPGYTVHVADLDGEQLWTSRTAWEQRVTVTVRDEHQVRIPGATVIGAWPAGVSGETSCVTDVRGECLLSSGALAPDRSSVSFNIIHINDTEHTYAPADNVDFDGDSNGTALVANRPVQPTVSVADLDGASSWISSSGWDAALTIAIVDNSGAPVANGTVFGRWKNGLSGTTTCVTDETGLCTIPVPSVADSIDEIEWEVTSIDHWLLLYKSDLNDDPDGDSDGDKIKVRPPLDRPTLHVGDLDGAASWISSSAWDATLTIAIVDAQGSAVPDTTVHGYWKNGLSGDTTCVTDSSGQCQVPVPTVADTITEIEWEILHVDHAMRYYRGDANGDPDGDSDGDKIRIRPPQERPTLHIADLDGASSWISSSAWDAALTIAVVDEHGAPVADATVHGHWKNGLSGETACVTDGEGVCHVPVSSVLDTINEIEWEALAIDHELRVYDDDDNDDPDSDSDGTRIKIEPPEARPAIHLTVESSAQWLADGRWEAAISFLVLDDGGAPVAGATVTGFWERGLSGDVSCMTDGSGHCMINGTLAGSAGEAKLRITQVEHSLLFDNYDYADQVQVRRPQ